MAKAPYKKKTNDQEILTFLKSVQGRHVTVNEICDFFREKGFRRNHDHLPSSGEDGERRSGR